MKTTSTKKFCLKEGRIVGAALLCLGLTGPASAQIIGSPTDTGGAARAGVGNAITNHANGTSGTATLVTDLPTPLQDDLRQGYQDFQDKKYPQATAELKDVEKQSPNVVEAHQMLTGIYLAQNKIADAIPEMEAIVRLTPKDAATRSNLGVAYMQVGSFDKASALYQAALAQNPRDPKLTMQYAISLARAGKNAEAAPAFERAAALSPKDNQAPLYAGLLNHQLGHDDRAVPELKTALALGTTQKFQAYASLAEAAAAAKQSGEAIQDYTLAAQANPADFGTEANLGVLNQNAGNKAAAEAAYRQALTLKAGDPKSMAGIQSNLSLLLIDEGKLDEAASLLTQAAAGDPTNARIQDNLGEVYEKQNKKDLAITAYTKALQLDPSLAGAKASLAQLKK